MRSIDLSNVNKSNVTMNRSNSLNGKFKSQFGETEKRDNKRGPEPPKLGVNSITVNIGDFKAQQQAEKSLMQHQ